MNKGSRLFRCFSYALAGALLFSSCSKQRPTSVNPGGESTATGLSYQDEEGFTLQEFQGQPAGPNLVYIEGGRTVLGSSEEDIMGSRDNLERTVTIASFYMDETEVANVHWLEYMFYVKRDSSEEFYLSTLPDTTVWEGELAYNDPYVDHYLRYPGFRYYPVVGVNWRQANDYCAWRTAVVNQKLAEDAGIEMEAEGGGRIPLETGAVLPNYRLPSEAEWEYAAQALVGTQYNDENQTHKRLYPWDGHALRNPYGKKMGTFLANFKRGRGDYAGIAGKLNDGAMITSGIYDYPPNDFGLYNMAGNVNEWVYDVYRPNSFQDFTDLNPIRRDGFLDEERFYDKANNNSLIDNNVHVYKGGSWKDVAYWLSPGTRRYLNEDSATSTIGFRCAMISAGKNF
jgi:sulfatase modifying factor 1